MLGASRLILLAGAILFVVGGLVAIVTGEPGGLFGGLILIACAVPLAVGGLREQRRYRAGRDEASLSSPYGPGGVPPSERLDPRFRATDEVFIDPSTGIRMRVYADATTGERRYRAEA